MSRNIFKEIERSVMNEQMEETTRQKLLGNLLRMKDQKINLMVTGATGVGKSSTINALFGEEVAKVGTSVNPETMGIDKYELDNLVIWDTPGLGDGREADNRHSKIIIDKLYEKDRNENLLIDLVLVILDGSSRDLGTSYELINSVIIPNLGENKKNRILVAINQADVAMKGKYWNVQENQPERKLQDFLEDKVASVRRRIKEATGIDVEPIYYSAGDKEEGYMQQKPYNLSKLLYYILQHTPEEKRLVYAQNINKEEAMWKDNDDLQDYRAGILEKFMESVTKGMAIGGTIGQTIGSLVGLGPVGRVIGTVGGAIVGVTVNIVNEFVDFLGGIF